MAHNKAKVYLEDDCIEDMLNKSWPIIAQGLFMLKEGTTTPKPNSTMPPCVALYVSCLDKIGQAICQAMGQIPTIEEQEVVTMLSRGSRWTLRPGYLISEQAKQATHMQKQYVNVQLINAQFIADELW